MRNFVFYVSMMVALGGTGCMNDYSNYQCKSNDECLVGSEGQTSCALDTSKCVAVTPITVTGTWKTPKVGQTKFSIELEASGGYPPYSWELTTNGGRLNWLTLKEDESGNRSKAWLTNNVVNNVPMPPQEAAELSEGLEIKVTVRDNTKQGKKDRVDNKGAEWETTVTIEKCTTEQCENDDGCCPSGCNSTNDNDCAVTCGNGVVETGETCDGNCPTSCDDSNPCTMDALENGGTCTATCTHTEISVCQSNDGCCPTSINCDNISDNDCSATCGNGIVEDQETCDGNCPTSCDDGNVCTTDTLIGSAAKCTAACVHNNVANGTNCGSSCNGLQWTPVTCQSGTCTTGTVQNCNDANSCTTDVCTAATGCSHPTTITDCISGDGCCPASCNHCNDTDCPTVCGDGCVSGSETCDGNCPTSCDDGVACTTDTLQNSGTCTATCTHAPITVCQSGDGCCPAGANCNNNTDSDCPVVCGNGVIETGETCDGNCSSITCPDDGNACTTESLTGSASTCNVVCNHILITSISSNGGCLVGVSFNMKYVLGGTFPTGTDDKGGNQTVSAFWMGETEVTYELWNAVYKWATTQGHGYTFANRGALGCCSGSGSQQQPVTDINWRDAMIWCNAASEAAGLTPVYYTDAGYTTPIRSVNNGSIDTTDGHEDNPYVKTDSNGFRLPGNMEWEYAARYRGADTTNSINVGGTYWTKGNSASGAFTYYNDQKDVNPANGVVDSKDANDLVAVYGHYWNGSSWIATGVTAPAVVKSKTPNTLGLYDMSGNVEEWCFDWYPGYGGVTYRVVRGGDWFFNADSLQIGYVSLGYPYYTHTVIGFRLARTK